MSTQTATKEAEVSRPVAVATPATDGTGQTGQDSFRLARFVALLFLDQRRLEFFVKNPDRRGELLSSEGLTEEEIALVTTGCFEKLCAYAEKAGSGPLRKGIPDSPAR